MGGEKPQNISEVKRMARLDELSFRLTHEPPKIMATFERSSYKIPENEVVQVRTELQTKLINLLGLLVPLHALSLDESSDGKMDEVERQWQNFQQSVHSIFEEYQIKPELES